MGPQGIFKPRVLDLPLSITTAPNGPCADAFGTDGLLRYKCRGTRRALAFQPFSLRSCFSMARAYLSFSPPIRSFSSISIRRARIRTSAASPN